MNFARIRIDQPGYDNFNENLMGVQFQGGASVDLVPEMIMNALGAIFRVVSVDTGAQVGAGVFENISRASAGMPPVAPASPTPPSAPSASDWPVTPTVENSKGRYTRESLEAIADAHGITGLREIGNPLGVKNTSINGLIEELMAYQAANSKAAE